MTAQTERKPSLLTATEAELATAIQDRFNKRASTCAKFVAWAVEQWKLARAAGEQLKLILPLRVMLEKFDCTDHELTVAYRDAASLGLLGPITMGWYRNAYGELDSWEFNPKGPRSPDLKLADMTFGWP